MAIDANNQLTKILLEWDGRPDSFEEHLLAAEIGKLVGELRMAEQEVPSTVQAEHIAFRFIEVMDVEQVPTRTFYQPMMTLVNDEGAELRDPDERAITPEQVEYWESRSKAVNHPVLVGRYAGLVWDYSKSVTGKPAGIEMARLVVASGIEYSRIPQGEFPILGRTKLVRSLNVAISIGDVGLISDVAHRMFEFEREFATDDKLGLWGFSFDLLIGNKKVALEKADADRIVEDMEERFARVIVPDDGHLNSSSIESSAIRLATHYRKLDKKAEVRRVLTAYRIAMVEAARKMQPMAGAVLLRKAYEVLLGFELADEARQVETDARSLGVEAGESAETDSHSVEIPMEKVSAAIEAMIAGSTTDALVRIARSFVPDKQSVDDQLDEIAEAAPLQAMFTRVIFDDDGEIIASVGALEEERDKHVTLKLAETISVWGPYLGLVFEELSKRGVDLEREVLDFVTQCPLCSDQTSSLLERGLKHVFAGDHLAGCTILIPQIEVLVRELIARSGGTTNKGIENGKLRRKTLGGLLRDPIISKTFDENTAAYLQTLLVDELGWNLRNVLCHGWFREEEINEQVSHRVIHVLLLFGLLRERTAEDQGEEEE